jgi:hypothetical protein
LGIRSEKNFEAENVQKQRLESRQESRESH